MRTRLLLTVSGLAVPAVVAGCASFLVAHRAAPDLVIERTPERVARGAYLANHVADCFGCHTPSKPGSHQPDSDRLGAGGRLMGPETGLPVEVYSSNLTPDRETGLGTWSDGEILRAMREGVDRDGTPLFPIMPYPGYRMMSDEDARAIVAYLRTLKPVRQVIKPRKLPFPFDLAVGLFPRPVDGPVPAPPIDARGRGKYLGTLGNCADCHTPRVLGVAVPGMDLAGGQFFAIPGAGPDGKGLPAANITPARTTGIGKWSDDELLRALSTGKRPDGKKLRPPMPWRVYAGMTEGDRRALVTYLRGLEPVEHDVGRRW